MPLTVMLNLFQHPWRSDGRIGGFTKHAPRQPKGQSMDPETSSG